jgi:hypothetical protein
MVKAKSAGQMEQSMKANINMVKKMGMENSIGLILPVLRVTFKIIIYMELVLINGQMAGSIAVIGI